MALIRRLSFQQQVLTGFSITFLFVFVVGLVSYLSIADLHGNEQWVDHTERVLNITKDIQQHLVDAETSQRGYILSGMGDFMDTHRQSSSQVVPLIQDLRRYVSDNHPQVKLVDSLNFYALKKITEMGLIIGTYEQFGFEGASKRLRTSKSKFYMAKVRQYIDSIVTAEDFLLVQRKQQTEHSVKRTVSIILGGVFLILCFLLFLFGFIKKTFLHQKLIEERIRQTNSQNEKISKENEKQNWMLTGSNIIGDAVREEHRSPVLTINKVVVRMLTELAQYLDARVGVIYLADESGQKLEFAGGYAFQRGGECIDSFTVGEGLLGQAALEDKMQVVQSFSGDHIKIITGLGESKPVALLIQPLFAEGKLKGIIELGFTGSIAAEVVEFVEGNKRLLGVEISTIQAKVQNQQLFDRIQQQSEELESQHEELRTTNDELVQKTLLLQASEEELRQINSELEDKARLLQEQNKAVEQARFEMHVKAEELEQSNRYKSEFLANMSHELRTPLNSILILARILKENKNDRLDAEQVKYAGVIHTAGSDLLRLINDILDLSKIESGKLEILVEQVDLQEMKQDMELLFNEQARAKGVSFQYFIQPGLPAGISSDKHRIAQILKNLLSNAFKFTPQHGAVSVIVQPAPGGISYSNDDLAARETGIIAFEVKDTGIGIAADKQRTIFEAFQQADGSISRQYGGTGLGLSICRELALLLNGEIQVESEPGAGSSFTLYLPVGEAGQLPVAQGKHAGKKGIQEEAASVQGNPALLLPASGEYKLLIIEDDRLFSAILTRYATERGFRVYQAFTGDSGIRMAGEIKPDGIVLDIMLPVVSGWEVLKSLKGDAATAHIPVHLMSCVEEGSRFEEEGAIGFLNKPVTKEDLEYAFGVLLRSSGKGEMNNVLIVEDEEVQNHALAEKLRSNGVTVVQTFNGREAMAVLNGGKNFDCIVLDLNLPDISGLELLEWIKNNEVYFHTPVIINTAMELDRHSMARVIKHTEAMVLKSNKSNERLLDEVNLFMNKVKGREQVKVTDDGLQILPDHITLEAVLKGKTVLIVDDDMRNIFALSAALERYDMKVDIANNGREALRKLDATPYIDIVLMDIMMPDMDGYEAMKAIRKQERFEKLPVIALTAKAMKDDQEKSMQAGANDYMSKPVDIDKLVGMMKAWLS